VPGHVLEKGWKVRICHEVADRPTSSAYLFEKNSIACKGLSIHLYRSAIIFVITGRIIELNQDHIFNREEYLYIN